MMELLMCPGFGIACLIISYFILWCRVSHLEDRNDERIEKKIDWLKRFDISPLDRHIERAHDRISITDERLMMEIEFLKKEINSLKK